MANKQNGDAVYLVLGENYQVIGVSSGDHKAYRAFGGKDNIKIVGPFYADEPIDWDVVQEESFGPLVDGRMESYIKMKDGVPMNTEAWVVGT